MGVRPLGETRNATALLRAPGGLPARANDIVQVDVSAEGAAHPEWQRPVNLHFRRPGDGWTLIGLDRGTGRAPAAEPRPGNGHQR